MAPSLLFLLPLLVLPMVVAALPATSTPTPSAAGGPGKLWALLVAGSKGYENYRHQADVCHAFQVLNSHGIPRDNIVVMMYDDIAEHDRNPTPGVIVQRHNGPNVYEGVLKDYTGENVTAENFLGVLQGQNLSAGSTRVINSSINDHIFVFFSGHGAPGMLKFPNKTDWLFAKTFIDVIKEMHAENRYGKMVIYVESCYSGSMFEGLLPDNVSVYATTAANAFEPSFSFCRDQYRNVSLGDKYSVHWMEHSENSDLIVTSLGAQYSEVRRRTKTSHVMQYGDTSMGKLPLSEFQGRNNSRGDIRMDGSCEPISNRDMPIVILNNTVNMEEDPAVKQSLQKELNQILVNRAFLEGKIDQIATLIGQQKKDNVESLLTSEKDLKNFDCYEAAVQHFDVKCFGLSANPYSLHHLRVLVNACESGYPLRDIISAMNSACTHKTIRGII